MPQQQQWEVGVDIKKAWQEGEQHWGGSKGIPQYSQEYPNYFATFYV
jgi:hypothetical protein